MPRLAAAAPAAALAEAVVYYGDQSLPKEPRTAFLVLMRKVGGSLAAKSDAGLIADARLVCTDLGNDKKSGAILSMLNARNLDAFDSHLMVLLAAQYRCQSHINRATQPMVTALNQSSATN